MSLNLIDLIKGQLGSALVTQAASQLGESESGISKAISALLPAVVGGLANNSDNSSVLDAVSNANNSGLLSNLLGGTSNNSLITTILTALFGDKIGGLVSAVSSYAGISNTSTNSLLNMVTGATLGSVGKYAADNNLGASGITSLLGEQKGILSSLLPAGLSLASLDFGSWFGDAKENVSAAAKVSDSFSDAKNDVKESVSSAFSDNDNNGGGSSIWKWLLPLLLLIAAGYFLWKQCEKKETTSTTTVGDSTMIDNDSSSMSTDTANTMTTTKIDENIDLNGTMLKGYKGGMEDNMISFLKAGSYTSATDDAALKDTWYSFDHVNFKIGSSTELEAGSQGQIDNLVAILKAFPDSKIKIGGYTDKTGNEADNVKLSTARANFIKAALEKAGVGAQVLGAEGYGSKFATVAKEASNDERAADRKMAVRFAK